MIDMVSPLVRHRVKPRESTETQYALVMGESGAGKTTLASELCKLQSGKSQKLVSVEERQNYYLVNQVPYSFVLIDASGHEDAEKLQKLIQSGSISPRTKVNTLFFVIKYDTRFERMMKSYFSIEEPVEKYVDRVIVMVSHWDHSKSPEKDFKEICELFEEECPKIVNFICYSDQHLNGELADLMFSCISNMKSDILKLTEEESALDDNQNANDMWEDTSSENKRQSSEGNSHQNTAAISKTKPHNLHEESLVVDRIGGKVADTDNGKVDTLTPDQGGNFSSHSSDHDFESTTKSHANNESRIYRAGWQDGGCFSLLRRCYKLLLSISLLSMFFLYVHM